MIQTATAAATTRILRVGSGDDSSELVTTAMTRHHDNI